MSTTREIRVDDPNLSAFGMLTLDIKSTSPLIQHKFSEKAKREMLDKQMGKAKAKKPAKDPVRNLLDAIHVIGRRPKTEKGLGSCRFGVPAVAFKSAAVRMAKLSGTPMTDARSMFFVEADEFVDGDGLVEIQTKPPVMHEGYVRIQGTTDIRHRPMFEKWSTTLRVQFNSRLITPEQLVSLFKNAGVSCGVGEMRPGGKQSSGVFGTFEVVRAVAEVPDMEADA